jgi:VanZ family protein
MLSLALSRTPPGLGAGATHSIERQDSGLMRGFNVLPWLLPGLIVSILVGFVLGRRVGRVVLAPPSVGWGLVVGFGLVVSATLTPLRGGLDLGTMGVGTCDFSRLGLAPLQELLRIGDTSLNVLLFIPLGFAVGMVPGSRRRNVLAAIAIVSPAIIESTQMLLPVLGRGCQSADVVDNLTGLVLGWVIGAGLRIAGGGIAPPPDPH